MHAYYEAQDWYLEGKAAWEAMSWLKQGELLDALPDGASTDTRLLYAAALVWQMSDGVPYRAWHDRWQAAISALRKQVL